MFGHSQIKYSIPIQAKRPDKKCIVLLFLIKNFKKTEKAVFLITISVLCSLSFLKKHYF